MRLRYCSLPYDWMSGGPVAAIVFDAKGLMYNLTLEGTKFTRLNR